MRKQRGVHPGRRGKAGLVLLLGLAVWGCGRSTATVSGHVHYQGSPLSAGRVVFSGPNHQVVNTFINADGSYTATNVPLGAVKVAVTTPAALLKHLEKVRAKGGKTPSTSGGANSASTNAVSIPARYNDPESSGLELTVTSGEQLFEIELK